MAVSSSVEVQANDLGLILIFVLARVDLAGIWRGAWVGGRARTGRIRDIQVNGLLHRLHNTLRLLRPDKHAHPSPRRRQLILQNTRTQILPQRLSPFERSLLQQLVVRLGCRVSRSPRNASNFGDFENSASEVDVDALSDIPGRPRPHRAWHNGVVGHPPGDHGKGGYEPLEDVERLPWLLRVWQVFVVRIWWILVVDHNKVSSERNRSRPG